MTYYIPVVSTCILVDALGQVIVLLVLMVHWMGISSHADIQFVEYFAGVGRLAQVAEGLGYTVAAFDIDYLPPSKISRKLRSKPRKRRPMDLNSDAGLVHLSETKPLLDRPLHIQLHACSALNLFAGVGI